MVDRRDGTAVEMSGMDSGWDSGDGSCHAIPWSSSNAISRTFSARSAVNGSRLVISQNDDVRPFAELYGALGINLVTDSDGRG